MKTYNEKTITPAEIEKELGNFLAKKFGDNVKIVSPSVFPEDMPKGERETEAHQKDRLEFDLKPEELIDYLDKYIVKQDSAKAVLSTKICTHFNRIKYQEDKSVSLGKMVGGIKNNILMLGPTGVGKTYIIKLIADKIGVPFVKGDATKFSETGYVGGDVEDLIRDLVKEAGDDIELAQYGIVYIDEIDKIAGARNIIGSDISRTGVQRALLKPMEETEVDLKVPHDPISMLQEIERFRKTGKRNKRVVNTKNILFIMSGAFADLPEIVNKRLTNQPIGFGSKVRTSEERAEILKLVKSEDLVEFGFESEFIGRLPIRAVFEKLKEKDLFSILRNPNNPIILGKKLDFAAYNIDIKFNEDVLRMLARNAFEENTGARGLVSAVEKALLAFEKRLPSIDITKFPVTASVISKREESLKDLESDPDNPERAELFKSMRLDEQNFILKYIKENYKKRTERNGPAFTDERLEIIAEYCTTNIVDTTSAVKVIESYYEEIRNMEVTFYRDNRLNIVFEDDAIDYIINRILLGETELEDFYECFNGDFSLGMGLIREKIGRDKFFITKEALISPENFIADIIKEDLSKQKEALGRDYEKKQEEQELLS